MNKQDAKNLCLKLMHADTENEVVSILINEGLWDKSEVWRFYGDIENNVGTIHAQQSIAEAALVEKLVNSVDARLLNECLASNINPESEDAPQSIREAVAVFFERSENPKSVNAGRLIEWTNEQRTAAARGIAFVATGNSPREGYPSFTVVDAGEGQTPLMVPETFLSLNKSIKLRTPFVQGKFNMGGSGALQFCGKNKLQLLVTKRNPALLNSSSHNESDSHWSFTIIRRELPSEGRKSSVYTYLAPCMDGKAPHNGDLLSFPAKTLPIFPIGKKAYAQDAEFGSLVKMYEYNVTGRSNILMPDGMLYRLNIRLPEVALPIRFYECRKRFRGHKGSFETNFTGLVVRLEEDKRKNLEFDPFSSMISIQGEKVTATIYAFKKDRGKTYKKNEGVLFTVNGQTQGHLTNSFFRGIGLSYIADSILVVVDCSKLNTAAIESLIMSSRDRLLESEFKREIENNLKDILKNHPQLRELKDRRRREEIEEKLSDSKPLEDVLESILKKDPTLSLLFLFGERVKNPVRTKTVTEEPRDYKGSKHPSYFKFAGVEVGRKLERSCHINLRCRINFETDVVNDYFDRKVDPGEFVLEMLSEGASQTVEDYSINLHNGIATLNVRLPQDVLVGQVVEYRAIVKDPTVVAPFQNRFSIQVRPDALPKRGNGKRKKPPGKDKGDEREHPQGIKLPKIKDVYEDDWEKNIHLFNDKPFNRFSALRVVNAGEEQEEGKKEASVYDFYINMDNVFLKTELKNSPKEKDMVIAKYRYGMVLLGLGLIHQSLSSDNPEISEIEDLEIEQQVDLFTSAASPVLLPMIEQLGGGLEIEDGVNDSE